MTLAVKAILSPLVVATTLALVAYALQMALLYLQVTCTYHIQLYMCCTYR